MSTFYTDYHKNSANLALYIKITKLLLRVYKNTIQTVFPDGFNHGYMLWSIQVVMVTFSCRHHSVITGQVATPVIPGIQVIGGNIGMARIVSYISFIKALYVKTVNY